MVEGRAPLRQAFSAVRSGAGEEPGRQAAGSAPQRAPPARDLASFVGGFRLAGFRILNLVMR